MHVSVIVATYNRCESLKVVLESLLEQKQVISFTFDVIIVNNNSTDGTEEMVKSHLPKWDGRLTYLDEKKSGKSNAVNKAIHVARGNILAFTDDDIIVDSLWLAHLVECFRVKDCDAVGGRVLPLYSHTTPQWIRANAGKLSGAVVIYDYGTWTMTVDKSRMYLPIGANFAFKRSVFDEVGLFNPRLGPGTKALGEDTEFIERLLKRGYKVCYCGDSKVYHPFDPKRIRLGHLARWHYALGIFDAHREMESGQQFVFIGRVPRYLITGLVKNVLKMSFILVSRLTFIDAWRAFFRKLGMIHAYLNDQKDTNA